MARGLPFQIYSLPSWVFVFAILAAGCQQQLQQAEAGFGVPVPVCFAPPSGSKVNLLSPQAKKPRDPKLSLLFSPGKEASGPEAFSAQWARERSWTPKAHSSRLSQQRHPLRMWSSGASYKLARAVMHQQSKNCGLPATIGSIRSCGRSRWRPMMVAHGHGICASQISSSPRWSPSRRPCNSCSGSLSDHHHALATGPGTCLSGSTSLCPATSSSCNHRGRP